MKKCKCCGNPNSVRKSYIGGGSWAIICNVCRDHNPTNADIVGVVTCDKHLKLKRKDSVK